jgi:hypothetical protein
MHEPKTIQSLLKSPEKITDADVRHFRRDVFQDGLVSPVEADAVFDLNDAVTDKCEAWNEFFIEALTDYTVQQAEPRGYVSSANAKWLVNRISHDGVVDSASELELLVRILAKADHCPPALAGYALAQIAYAVVEGEGPLARGMSLTKGVIGEAEVELLRTILYAAGGANGISISKQEAEILFDLNDHTDEKANHPSWQDLFVRASANYLMAVSGYQAPSRTEALARQEWLEDTEEDVTGFMGSMVSGLGGIFSEGFFDDIFTSSHVQMEKAWKARNQAVASASNTAEAIDPAEAAWLVDRIGRDGKVKSSERALLEFIRKESHRVDPKVIQLMDKVA